MMLKICIGLRGYLTTQLQAAEIKRESLQIDFLEALALGDDVENAPLDAAKFAIELNEHRISKFRSSLESTEFINDVTDEIAVIGSKVQLQSIDTDRILNLVLIHKDHSVLIPDEFRPLSLDTELGEAVYEARVNSVIDVGNTGRFRLCRIYSY